MRRATPPGAAGKGRPSLPDRAADKHGRTVECCLGRTRNVVAAKAFRRQKDPRVTTRGGFEPSHAALDSRRDEKKFHLRWECAVQIRACPHLIRVVEQDQRRIKSWMGPMLGFKRFSNAHGVVAGVEPIQKTIKGSLEVPSSFDPDAFRVWRNVIAA